MPVRKADTPPIPLPFNSPHHLQSLADEVHRTYFFKFPPLPVRWGQQITRKKRRSIRLGSYNHATTEVRIHPILNGAHVPYFFIQSVIFHEYLHHVLGPHHNSKFHRAERQFRYYRESQEWVRRNLWILLGRKRSELRRSLPPAEVAQPVQAALF